MGANAAVTVGSGGSGGSPNSGQTPPGTGSTGGSSTFDPAGTGTTLTGNGGVGSGGFYQEDRSQFGGTYSKAGIGGSASGGQLNFSGQKGANTQSNPNRWVHLEVEPIFSAIPTRDTIKVIAGCVPLVARHFLLVAMDLVQTVTGVTATAVATQGTTAL